MNKKVLIAWRDRTGHSGRGWKRPGAAVDTETQPVKVLGVERRVRDRRSHIKGGQSIRCQR